MRPKCMDPTRGGVSTTNGPWKVLSLTIYGLIIPVLDAASTAGDEVAEVPG